MTLIYGAVDSTDGFLVGDALFSQINETGTYRLREDEYLKIGSDYYGLKIHILRKNLAISYAGDVFLADETISSFYKSNKKFDGQSFLNLFLKKAEDSDKNNNACEFLILDTTDKPQLIKISEGKICPLERGYIGDGEAYRCFQKNRNLYVPPTSMIVHLPDLSIDVKPCVTTELENEREDCTRALKAITLGKKSNVGIISQHPFVAFRSCLTDTLIYQAFQQAELCPYDGESKEAILTTENEPYAIGVFFSKLNKGFLFRAGHIGHKEVSAEDQANFKKKAKTQLNIEFA